jgi:hypothetical protein
MLYHELSARIKKTSITVILPFLFFSIGNDIDFSNICVVYLKLQICIITVR